MTDVLMALQTILFVIAVILGFLCESEFWQNTAFVCFIVGIISSIMTIYMPKTGIRFHLFLNENVLAKRKAKNVKDKPCYTRLTNFRLVISCYRCSYITVECVTDIIAFLQRPNTVDLEFVLKNISKYQMDKEHQQISFWYDNNHYTLKGKKEFIELLAKTIADNVQ